MSGHTPGPWTKLGAYMYGRDGQWPITEVQYGKRDPVEDDANANLIAAAPDLLEALEAVQAFLDCTICGSDWPCVDHAMWKEGVKAAIAAARRGA